MISIDITDTQIKLVEAVVSGVITVKKAATRDLPVGCIENGRISDMHIVAGEITDILVTEKISDRDAIICINSGMIIYKEIEIPKPKKGKEGFVVESIIQNEMGLGSDFNITYSISGIVKIGEEEKLKVVATACPQKVIDIYVQLGQQVGLRTKQIVVSTGCITRLIRRSSVYRNVSPLLTLHVDKTFINISLYNHGAVVFSRHTRIDASDYENSKDYVNLAIFDNVFRMTHMIDQYDLSGDIEEIQYFGVIKDEKSLQSTLKQLELKSREFDFPTDLVRKRTVDDFSPYVNIIGSFLKVDPKTESINLLNTREKRVKTRNTQFGFTALIAAVLCAAFLGGLMIFINIITNLRITELTNLESTFESLRFNEANAYLADMGAAMNNLDAYSDNVDRAKVLFAFQPKMTKEIALQINEPLLSGMEVVGDFKVNKYELEVSFFCTKDTDPVDYAERLIERGYFEDVRLYAYSTFEGDGDDNREGYGFSVKMKVKGGNIFES